jgi:hypothetical protein
MIGRSFLRNNSNMFSGNAPAVEDMRFLVQGEVFHSLSARGYKRKGLRTGKCVTGPLCS